MIIRCFRKLEELYVMDVLWNSFFLRQIMIFLVYVFTSFFFTSHFFTNSFYDEQRGRGGCNPLRYANAVVFVYDETDITSFTDIKNWLINIQRFAYGLVFFFVIGNKVDLIK